MKLIKRIGLTLAWLGMAVLFPWLVMGPLGPKLERLWTWGVAHLPGAIQRWMQPRLDAHRRICCARPGRWAAALF